MKIPGYEIEAELGAGGMGVVYRARDVELDRPVAIKMLHTLSDEALERFNQEARAIARIGPHPHFTTIYTFGVVEGQPYIVMEYLDGVSLETAMQAGKPSALEDRLTIVKQMCDGLHFAHSQGILAHRDIKPANIQLTGIGQVKIMDFGIAKLADELALARNLTRANMIIGTLHYMSPEQIRGEKLDHRTDIWSAGVVLYQLLYHKRPYESADDVELMKKIVLDDVAIGPLDHPQSDDLLAILQKALEKDRERRYGTAGQMVQDLAAYLRMLDVSADRPWLPGKKKTARDYHREGMRQYAAGHLARAIKSFEKVLELDPERIQAQDNIAICQEAMHDKRVAELRNLATLLFNAKDYDATLPVVDELLALMPDDVEGQALKGWTRQALDERAKRARAAAATTRKQQGQADL